MIKVTKAEKMRHAGTGFTLIELLVSSAIFVVLLSGFLALRRVLGQNRVTAWVSYQSIEESNRAIDTISRELRKVTESETGSYPLDTANDQEIIFYSDYDFDGVVERVRYALTNAQLVKGVVEPSGTPLVYTPADENVKTISEIIRNGPDPIFYYYNSQWPTDTANNPLALADRISDTRHIKIVLVANPTPDQPEFDYILETDIRFRMLNN